MLGMFPEVAYSTLEIRLSPSMANWDVWSNGVGCDECGHPFQCFQRLSKLCGRASERITVGRLLPWCDRRWTSFREILGNIQDSTGQLPQITSPCRRAVPELAANKRPSGRRSRANLSSYRWQKHQDQQRWRRRLCKGGESPYGLGGPSSIFGKPAQLRFGP